MQAKARRLRAEPVSNGLFLWLVYMAHFSYNQNIGAQPGHSSPGRGSVPDFHQTVSPPPDAETRQHKRYWNFRRDFRQLSS
jgi:hypothetical protein